MDFDTLIHCDCIEYMKNMAKNSVDLTLTDIPYCEVNSNAGHNGMDKRNLDKDEADTKTFELSEFLPLVDKITKGAIVIFCGIEQFAEIFTYFKKKKYPARHLVWSKTNPSIMNGEKEYLASVENAVWTKAASVFLPFLPIHKEKALYTLQKRIRFEGGYYPSLFDDSEIIEKDKEVKMQSLFEELENGENQSKGFNHK